MSFEIRMILIYSIIFVIIGLFVWLIITMKNRKEKAAMEKDYDYSNNNEESDEMTLADYDNIDDYIIIPSRKEDENSFDSIDDFLNNFSYREDNYDVPKEEEMEYSVPAPIENNLTEVVNVLIGKKAYIFLANGNKLDNGTKIILKIDDKNYNGTVVRGNYERDLTSLKAQPRALVVVKILNN